LPPSTPVARRRRGLHRDHRTRAERTEKRRKWGEACGAATVAIAGSTPAGAVGHPPASRRPLWRAPRERGKGAPGCASSTATAALSSGRRRRSAGSGDSVSQPPPETESEQREWGARVSDDRFGRFCSKRPARTAVRSPSDGQEQTRRAPAGHRPHSAGPQRGRQIVSAAQRIAGRGPRVAAG
jgi:hypothetical protein